MGGMGGPGVWACSGWSACEASVPSCCARPKGRSDAWRSRVEGFAETRRFTIHIRGGRPIDADFLWLPPRTPGTIEASERAFSAAPTASAKAPRSALA